MSNMIPQSPGNNSEVWRELEEYSRDLLAEEKELYILAGLKGKDGTIAEGRIFVPQYTWKAILVLDKSSVENIFAVLIPNNDSVANTDWQDYLVSVDEVEIFTGYDFFSKLTVNIQNQVES